MALKRKKGTLNAANLISNLLIQKITKLFFLNVFGISYMEKRFQTLCRFEEFLRGLDGDSLELLVLTCVHSTLVPRLVSRDDPSSGQEGVRQGGLAMVHMGDDRDVPNLLGSGHHPSYLFFCVFHLQYDFHCQFISAT